MAMTLKNLYAKAKRKRRSKEVVMLWKRVRGFRGLRSAEREAEPPSLPAILATIISNRLDTEVAYRDLTVARTELLRAEAFKESRIRI